MKRTVTLILCCFLYTVVHAQEYLGLRSGNYAGIHGIALNPAVNVNGPKQWNINIFSMGFFFDNNYVFLEKANLPLAVLKGSRLRPNPAIQLDRKPIENPLYYNYHDRQKQLYNFHTNAFVMGPSAMFNYNDHSFGIYFANKVSGFAHRIATDYGYYYYQDSSTTEMFLDPMKVGLMHYGEFGINYAKKVTQVGMADLNIGVTAKYIIGWDGVFLRNNVRKESIKIENGVKIPEGSDVDFNWASNYYYDYENENANYQLRKNADGISFDIGLTLTDRQGADEYIASNWRVGVAVLDVGNIWFNRNAESNVFKTTDTTIFRDEYLANVKDLDSFRAVVNFQAFGKYEESVTGQKFSVRAPLAISAFADIHIAGSFFASANIIMRIPMKGVSLERANVVAITPRIEKEHKEFAFPISLYNFTSPRMGFFVRKKFFFFGTDNVTSWFIPQKLGGMDMYMGFKWDGNAFFKKNNRNLGGRGKVLRCPVW